MKKKQHSRLIHRALDGEATPSETQILRRKLQTDLKARSEFEMLKKIVKETRKVRMDVPLDFTQKVLRESTRIHRTRG